MSGSRSPPSTPSSVFSLSSSPRVGVSGFHLIEDLASAVINSASKGQQRQLCQVCTRPVVEAFQETSRTSRIWYLPASFWPHAMSTLPAPWSSRPGAGTLAGPKVSVNARPRSDDAVSLLNQFRAIRWQVGFLFLKLFNWVRTALKLRGRSFCTSEMLRAMATALRWGARTASKRFLMM